MNPGAYIIINWYIIGFQKHFRSWASQNLGLGQWSLLINTFCLTILTGVEFLCLIITYCRVMYKSCAHHNQWILFNHTESLKRACAMKTTETIVIRLAEIIHWSTIISMNVIQGFELKETIIRSYEPEKGWLFWRKRVENE